MCVGQTVFRARNLQVGGFVSVVRWERKFREISEATSSKNVT
jgi:hypothetical protein